MTKQPKQPTPKPTPQPALAKAPTREHPVAPARVASALATSETVMLSARVEPALRQAVKRHAVEHGTSVQQVVVEALRAYLGDTPPR